MRRFKYSKNDFGMAFCVGEARTALDRVTATANEVLDAHLEGHETYGVEEWELLRMAGMKLAALAADQI